MIKLIPDVYQGDVRLWLYETLTRPISRARCRLMRRHNITCRSRNDHTAPSGGIVDPDRWSSTWW